MFYGNAGQEPPRICLPRPCREFRGRWRDPSQGCGDWVAGGRPEARDQCRAAAARTWREQSLASCRVRGCRRRLAHRNADRFQSNHPRAWGHVSAESWRDLAYVWVIELAGSLPGWMGAEESANPQVFGVGSGVHGHVSYGEGERQGGLGWGRDLSLGYCWVEALLGKPAAGRPTKGYGGS